MDTIFACIDGRTPSAAVVDAAIWAAQRLVAPLGFVHVLEPYAVHAALSDHGGALGLGVHDALLHELGQLDLRRAELQREIAEGLLARACAQAQAAGVSTAQAWLRQGELDETLEALQPQTLLLLLGAHYHPGTRRRLHWDHRIEAVLRRIERPVLVLPGPHFSPPQQALIAFDGSLGARQCLQLAAASALLQGLALTLLWVGGDPAQARAAMQQAQEPLRAAGREARIEWSAGEPDQVLPQWLDAHPDTLLLMGAHGHSRLHQLLLGSTTATLLRSVQVPVLVSR